MDSLKKHWTFTHETVVRVPCETKRWVIVTQLTYFTKVCSVTGCLFFSTKVRSCVRYKNDFTLLHQCKKQIGDNRPSWYLILLFKNITIQITNLSQRALQSVHIDVPDLWPQIGSGKTPKQPFTGKKGKKHSGEQQRRIPLQDGQNNRCHVTRSNNTFNEYDRVYE